MVRSNTTRSNSTLQRELSAIEGAYDGKKVDLYKNVLKVSPHASQAEIQKAFFQRRQELFVTLGDPRKKQRAEKQMDALVLCYRIVGDLQMRQEYNSFRTKRTVTPPKQDRLDQQTNRVYVMHDRDEEPSTIKRKKDDSSSSYVGSDTEDTLGNTIFSSDTVLSGETEYTLAKKSQSFLAQAAEEIEGCFEDTLSAFDQILHVFTLEEQDIRAVTGKIQKAKRDLEM